MQAVIRIDKEVLAIQKICFVIERLHDFEDIFLPKTSSGSDRLAMKLLRRTCYDNKFTVIFIRSFSRSATSGLQVVDNGTGHKPIYENIPSCKVLGKVVVCFANTS